MGVVLINGILLTERAKMSADWPFVQVIIPGVRGFERLSPSGRGRGSKEF
jgi:hypothetical protein